MGARSYFPKPDAVLLLLWGRLQPFAASKNFNGDRVDRYAILAKVRATMVGIVTDPRGDAN